MQSAKRGIVLLLCGIMVWNLAYNSNLVVSAQNEDTATIQTEDVLSSGSGNDALETAAPSDVEDVETGTEEGTEDDDNSVGDDIYEEDSEDGIALMAASDESGIMVADDTASDTCKWTVYVNGKDIEASENQGMVIHAGDPVKISFELDMADGSREPLQKKLILQTRRMSYSQIKRNKILLTDLITIK